MPKGARSGSHGGVIMPGGEGEQEGNLSDLLLVTPICQNLQEARKAGDAIWEGQPLRFQAV